MDYLTIYFLYSVNVNVFLDNGAYFTMFNEDSIQNAAFLCPKTIILSPVVCISTHEQSLQFLYAAFLAPNVHYITGTTFWLMICAKLASTETIPPFLYSCGPWKLKVQYLFLHGTTLAISKVLCIHFVDIIITYGPIFYSSKEIFPCQPLLEH